MNIAVRLEGGIGDHICAARFIPAIKELHPDSRIIAFSDTEGNTSQRDFLVKLWPGVFDEIEIINSKRNKEFPIKHQFSANENYPSALENVPENYLLKMKSADKFYDLHIDGMNWASYDFNWSKYFYTFPKPQIALEPVIDEKEYIVLNLVSDSNSTHKMEPWYVNKLVERLSKTHRVIIAATDKNEKYYSDCAAHAKIVKLDILGVTRLIANAKLFLTLDSGLKFIGYSTNTPTLNFCNQVTTYGEVPQHQIIRWQPFPFSVLPLYYPLEKTLEAVNFCIKYKTNTLPVCDFDKVFVKRIYTTCTTP